MADVTFQMPDGTSRTATVDDGIKNLPQDQQVALVGRMREAALAAPAPTPASTEPTFAGDIKGGLHDLGTSVSQGLKVAGGIATRNGMTSVGPAVSSAGDKVASYTPDAPAGPAPSELLADDIKSGNWRSGAGHLMHSAIRAAPSTAALLGAGALGGPIAAGAAGAGMAVGPLSYERAANNGRTEPTTMDTVAALPGVVGEGLGGALVPGGSKIANPVLRAGAKVASEAAGGAIMDTAGQLGGTVGTDKGASLDLPQVAASALTQGAIGGVRAGRDLAGAGARSVGDAITPPPSVDQAASNMRVVSAHKDFNGASGRDLSDTDALNSIKTDAQTKLTQLGQSLFENGAVDRQTYNTVVRPAIDMAVRHNKELFSTEGGESAWDRVQKLDLPPEIQKALTDGLTDLSTLSVAARKNRETGPMEKIGRGIGTATSVGLGALGGSYLPIGGPVAGALGGFMGRGRFASPLGNVGAGMDRMMGWSGPDVVRSAQRSQAVLDAAGREPGTSTLRSLSDAHFQAANPPTPAEVAGITPEAKGSAQAANNQAALLARLGPDHPVGQAAAEALGDSPLAQQAMQRWNAMAPVRDAQAKLKLDTLKSQEQAAQDAKDTTDRLKRDKQSKQSDLEAALGQRSRMTSAIDKATTKNEDILQTANEEPIAPDASLTAINAAMNQAQRRANAVKAAGGENRLGVPTDAEAPTSPVEPPQASPAPTPAAPPPEAVQTPSQAPNGYLPLQDYIQHTAMARHGKSITPEHIAAGLDALAGKGHVTPDQYDFYKQSLGSPLMNPGGMHNPMIDAITAHAVGAASGGEAPAGRPAGNTSGVRNPLSYAANLRQEASIAANIVATHPEMADQVNQIRDAEANAKTAAGRRAVLAKYLATVPDKDKARQEAILKPLTGFGQK